MKLLAVAAELIQEAGLGEVGIDLFIGTMPADTTVGVMLRAPLMGTEEDEGTLDFYNARFQVIVRDNDAERGYETCDRISKALRVNRLDRSDLLISWMRRETLPVSYPRGDADDIETSVVMNVGFGKLV